MLRELKEEESIHFLKSNSIGRIGCTDGENVYVVPTNYRFEGNSIICYSLEGLKIDIMRHHATVCFEVDEIVDSNNWKCVIVNGVFEEITDKAELNELRPRYTEYFLRKRTTLAFPTSATQAEKEIEEVKAIISNQVFYRIQFSKISGRTYNGLE
ncbi:pyridoxamine 5'-phosphate oxidase family protein [Adhaeribacter radiodurans]|uniref:Pyridoxamine 5'-phosphate oxidase family protein n=1 Tax=Adhaeribacter radiodurans TaxID=2745197 RepID=A0A7L7L1K9_9BACT|nr:pyridoxamine 5'-phosphate oxidase family protein [Adhaeribacter radiodurans]QMU26650.1 pyridoxamine 5'-phosphate oxidase family protein [Adhaeribacter radiodurans]